MTATIYRMEADSLDVSVPDHHVSALAPEVHHVSDRAPAARHDRAPAARHVSDLSPEARRGSNLAPAARLPIPSLSYLDNIPYISISESESGCMMMHRADKAEPSEKEFEEPTPRKPDRARSLPIGAFHRAMPT